MEANPLSHAVQPRAIAYGVAGPSQLTTGANISTASNASAPHKLDPDTRGPSPLRDFHVKSSGNIGLIGQRLGFARADGAKRNEARLAMHS